MADRDFGDSKSVAERRRDLATSDQVSLIEIWRIDKLRLLLVRELSDKEGASIFVRMIQSKHLVDLQLIAFAIFIITFVVIFLAVFGALYHTYFSSNWKIYSLSHNGFAWWRLPRYIGDSLSVAIPIIGGYLALAAAVLAWCYRSGNERLGIIDLFASEITSLCRVCTVNKLTESCVASAESSNLGARAGFRHFESIESYTPIFDSNASDLKVLDVDVVTNVTAFYTYWKAMRDSFRHLAGGFAENVTVVDNGAWFVAMRGVIYMQFLAFESARKALADLIEFEPHQVENTITVLLSELPAFGFLYCSFDRDDVRFRRLNLRMHDYPTVIEGVNATTKNGVARYPELLNRVAVLSPRELKIASAWDKANEMLHTLDQYYDAVKLRVQKGPKLTSV